MFRVLVFAIGMIPSFFTLPAFAIHLTLFIPGEGIDIENEQRERRQW